MADADSRTGARYATPEIVHWLDTLHAGHDAGLEQAFLAPGRNGMPAIQVGISEGKLLTLLLRMAGAKKVVEFGTLAGYSAIRMAKALPPDGHLWSLEFDPKHAAVARANIEAAGFAAKVTVLVGPALDALPELDKLAPFDTVCIPTPDGLLLGLKR